MADMPLIAITGARKGLGMAIAQHFLERDFLIAGCSRGESSLSSSRYHHTCLDVGDEAAVSKWVRFLRVEFGRVDAMICNAGYAPAAILQTMTTGKVLEETFRTNVMGTYFAAREAAKIMMRQKSGRIMTLSSMAVGLHLEGTSAYAASKSAVVEMTKILAKEMAPFSVTCNVIAPSMVMTDAVHALGEKIIDNALGQLTIKRPLTNEEVCHVIAFLMAPEGGCITGQVIQMGLVS